MSNIRKALVPLVTAAAAILVQLLATDGGFNDYTELVTAVVGVASAAVVYYVPNVLSVGLAGVRKALVPLGLAAVAFAVQYLNTGTISDSQELVTAATGVLTALFVFWVPNSGQPSELA